MLLFVSMGAGALSQKRKLHTHSKEKGPFGVLLSVRQFTDFLGQKRGNADSMRKKQDALMDRTRKR